ncbi:MAG: FHA domain-containing protein [Gammaproteobacteria bacterium]
MPGNIKRELKKIESRIYIIGREGHIYLNDPAASKRHAEIRIMNGEIYLRDLDSTNGIYLVKNQKFIRFLEGYVQLNQTIVLGNSQYTINDLLKIAGAFAA